MGSRLIIAMFVGLFSITGIVFAGLIMARPANDIFVALNGTIYGMTGGSGTLWTWFGGFNNFFHNLYGPVIVVLCFFWVIWVYLWAGQKEYVTRGRYR